MLSQGVLQSPVICIVLRSDHDAVGPDDRLVEAQRAVGARTASAITSHVLTPHQDEQIVALAAQCEGPELCKGKVRCCQRFLDESLAELLDKIGRHAPAEVPSPGAGEDEVMRDFSSGCDPICVPGRYFSANKK